MTEFRPEAKRVAFFSIGAVGHVHPTLAIVRELVLRGCAVEYYAHEPFRAAIEEAGACFRPYVVDGARVDDVLAFVRSCNPTRSAPLCVQPAAVRLLPALVRAASAAGRRPDVCCHDLLAPWGAYLARRLGVPAVCFSVTVLNDDDHVATLAGAGDRPNETNARAIAALREDYGVATRWEDAMCTFSRTTLVLLPEEFQPAFRSRTPRAAFRFVGQVVNARRSLCQSAAWDDFARACRERARAASRVVFVSMGTTVVADARFWRVVRRAFGADPDALVVCALGSSASDEMAAQCPPNTLWAASVPQLEVLALAHVFVTQAGMNSVLEALLAGVPMVCLPHFGDQPGIANAVQDLGAGLMVDPLDAGRLLRDSVYAVLSDPAYARAAKGLGDRLAASSGASAAAELILDELDEGAVAREAGTDESARNKKTGPGLVAAPPDRGRA